MKSTSPQCPHCKMWESRVIQTCRLSNGAQVRRRRCSCCGKAWYTRQPAEVEIKKWQLAWSQGSVIGLRSAGEIEEKQENIANQ